MTDRPRICIEQTVSFTLFYILPLGCPPKTAQTNLNEILRQKNKKSEELEALRF